MKYRATKRAKLRMLLARETGCGIQHTGWPCNSCFHSMGIDASDDRIHELWCSTLQLRGDYKPEELVNEDGVSVWRDDATLTKDVDELIRLLGG